MTIHISDLTSTTGLPINDPRRQEFLYCPACCAQYGANKGDYWNCANDKELVCECGEYFVLAREECRIVVVKQ